MQLKETGAGEVTVWLAEMAVTIGGTDEEEAAQRKERRALTTTLVTGTQPSPMLPCLICLVYLASKWESLQVDSGQQGRQYTKCVCAVQLKLTAWVGPVLPQCAFTCVLSHLIKLSLDDLHSTMSCVLSELAPTPLEAVQVMLAKVISLITLGTLSIVTL